MAPDAQLITMKVFGKNGGAYESDYLVAIEDAIVLKVRFHQPFPGFL